MNALTPHSLPAGAPQAATAPQPQGWPDDVAAMLATCLALVRPAGMSNNDATAWLHVAIAELGDLPRDVLAEACSTARRTCTRHGQIVPAIVREAAAIEARRRAAASAQRLARSREAQPQTALPGLGRGEPWRPSPAELEAVKADCERKAGRCPLSQHPRPVEAI